MPTARRIMHNPPDEYRQWVTETISSTCIVRVMNLNREIVARRHSIVNTQVIAAMASNSCTMGNAHNTRIRLFSESVNDCIVSGTESKYIADR